MDYINQQLLIRIDELEKELKEEAKRYKKLKKEFKEYKNSSITVRSGTSTSIKPFVTPKTRHKPIKYWELTWIPTTPWTWVKSTWTGTGDVILEDTPQLSGIWSYKELVKLRDNKIRTIDKFYKWINAKWVKDDSLLHHKVFEGIWDSNITTV